MSYIAGAALSHNDTAPLYNGHQHVLTEQTCVELQERRRCRTKVGEAWAHTGAVLNLL
jgi:hypothetical protein